MVSPSAPKRAALPTGTLKNPRALYVGCSVKGNEAATSETAGGTVLDSSGASCSVTGSTPIKRVKDQNLTEAANIIEFQTYSQCVDQLLSKQVDAVTTDDAILKGYAAQQPDQLKLVGDAFSSEPYGIGLNKDDSVLRNKIDDLLQASFDNGTWKKIYDATLGKSGSAATPPALQRN